MWKGGGVGSEAGGGQIFLLVRGVRGFREGSCQSGRRG